MTTPIVEPTASRLAWLAHVGDIVRLLQLIFVIIIAALVFWQDQSAGKKCSLSTVVELLTSAAGPLVPAELAGNIKKIIGDCTPNSDERHIAEVALNVLEARVGPVNPGPVAFGPTGLSPFDPLAQYSRVVVTPSRPADTGPVANGGGASTGSSTTPKGGWVAVGYVEGEASFKVAGDRPIRSLAAGDTITAQQPVNLRKGAADWSNPIGVVGKGTTVKVVEPPKTLKAGTLMQVWAHIEFE